jgi:hypothetical protein
MNLLLLIVTTGTLVIYLITRKEFDGKTIPQKIFKLIIYASCVSLGLIAFLEILHIVKYHETSL